MIPEPSEYSSSVFDSTREITSERLREPSPSESRALTIALTIAWGADCPVMEVRAAENSSRLNDPSPSISYFENRDSAETPLETNRVWRFFMATASNPALTRMPRTMTGDIQQ